MSSNGSGSEPPRTGRLVFGGGAPALAAKEVRRKRVLLGMAALEVPINTCHWLASLLNLGLQQRRD